MALPRKLKNLNLFNDGHSYMGVVKSVTLPKLTTKTEEWRGGGMDIPVDVDMGMEKLTVELTLGGYDAQVMKQFGAIGVADTLLRFTGALQRDDSGEVTAVEVVMRGRFTEIDKGDAEAGEDTEVKLTASLSYYKEVMDGEELVEIDALTMVKKVNGVDLLEPYRRALGI